MEHQHGWLGLQRSESYRAVDPENPRIQASGYLRNGQLDLSMRSKLEDGTRGVIRAAREFKAILRHFGVANIKSIQGKLEQGRSHLDSERAIKMASKEPKDLTVSLRQAYEGGRNIADILRNEPAFAEASPADMMWALMEAFDVGLSDVSCIDGWARDGSGEVTDQNLDLYIRDAIEQHRSTGRR